MEQITVTLKLDVENHAWLKKTANENMRSFAKQIAYMIKQEINKERQKQDENK